MKSIYNNLKLKQCLAKSFHPGGLELSQKLIENAWPKNAIIADVGCGLGATLNLLLSFNYKALGFDNNAEILNKTKKNTSAPLFLASAHKLPIANNYLNGLICECVFPHLNNKKAVLKEFYRVLKPEGKLIFSDLEINNFPHNLEKIELEKFKNRTQLLNIGFKNIEITDYTNYLKEMLAQLVWQGFDLSDFQLDNLQIDNLQNKKLKYYFYTAIK